MMRTAGSTDYLASINKLQALQAQLKYYDHAIDQYKKAIEIYQEYLECIQFFEDPRALINAYIRFAGFCEKMADLSFSRELYQEAMNLMVRFGLDDPLHLRNLRQKLEYLQDLY